MAQMKEKLTYYNIRQMPLTAFRAKAIFGKRLLAQMLEAHTCDCEDLQLHSWVKAVQEGSFSKMTVGLTNSRAVNLLTPWVPSSTCNLDQLKKILKLYTLIINSKISLPRCINTQKGNRLGQSHRVERINLAKKMFLTVGSWTLAL